MKILVCLKLIVFKTGIPVPVSYTSDYYTSFQLNPSYENKLGVKKTDT